MRIIGAGMAGLLAGVLFPDAEIYEAKSELPQEHKAVFRLRSDAIAKITGIPMEEVLVHKALWFEGEERAITPRLAHLYSQKVTGQISQRSIFDLDSKRRWIPPTDFVQRLADKCKGRIKFNTIVDEPWNPSPTISTIPMPVLSELLPDTPAPENYAWDEIRINQFHVLCCHAHATIYYPHLNFAPYRATLSGSTVIIESNREVSHTEFVEVFRSLGLPSVVDCEWTIRSRKQEYGKISPIGRKARKEFIVEATLKHNIYSLGRFATWRPGLMLDDVLEDIYVIRQLIEGGNYDAKRRSI